MKLHKNKKRLISDVKQDSDVSTETSNKSVDQKETGEPISNYRVTFKVKFKADFGQ